MSSKCMGVVAAVAVALVFGASVQADVYTVPGTANPWLAGALPGTVAGDGYDTAPAESPVQVTGRPITPGSLLQFTATGIVDHTIGKTDPGSPDGDTSQVVSRTPGAENGIADVTAPIDALIGVFLNDAVPGSQPAPAALNFSTQASRDYLVASPGLNQPFFIGDGLTSGGQQQSIVVPTGATRLFLGTMDGYQWTGNSGAFTVGVVPEPTAAIVLVGAVPVLCRRQRRT